MFVDDSTHRDITMQSSRFPSVDGQRSQLPVNTDHVITGYFTRCLSNPSQHGSPVYIPRAPFKRKKSSDVPPVFSNGPIRMIQHGLGY